MSREQRGPNEKLGTVLALAGISNAGLARRVNDLGAQRGLTLRYDKTSVARWVAKGMVPQGAAPHLIAAAIGAKLGRPVPLHEIGLADADPAPEVGLAFPRDVNEAVRSATDLYRLDLAGRRGGGGIWQSLAGSFAVSAYATPASRWLITPADPSVARDPTAAQATILGTEGAPGAQGGVPVQPGPDTAADGPLLRVGHSDVTKLREAAQDARRWDSKYGGGDWRSSMVPECLRVDAAPLLLGSYSDEVGRALFGASAELTRLMRLDGLRHRPAGGRPALLHPGTASGPGRRRRTAGRLCPGVDVASGDLPGLRRRGRGPRAGRRRTQPGARHRPDHELLPAGGGARPCQGGRRTGRGGRAPGRRAGWSAHALGDSDPAWLGFYSYDRFAADAAECYRDLKAPRQVRRFTEQALSKPTDEFVRSHGLRLVVSAVAELESGNLDAACAAGTRAVEVAGRISSARTTEYVRDLLHRLEPYGDEPRVAELRERARPLLVAPKVGLPGRQTPRVHRYARVSPDPGAERPATHTPTLV